VNQNKQLIAEAFDSWAAGTGGPFTLLADDARWTITGNSVAAGTYTSRGDTVVALFDASATVRDGQPYRNTYAWFMTLRGGVIVDVVAFFDGIEFDDLWSRVQPA
jgi:ketosteroid isomerase-like protein